MLRRGVVITLLLTLLGIALAGTVVAQDALRFYVIAHQGATDPFWATQKRAVEEAGQALGVRVIFEGPEQFSIAKQVDLFNSALAADPDGIAVVISDDQAWVEPLERAKAQDVPVVALNIPDFTGRADYLAYIGMDETVSGERVAERMLPHLSQGDRVVVAIHQPGLVVLEMRFSGIERTLAAAGITVDKLDVGQDPSQGAELLKSYFTRNPDTRAIFTLGPLGTTAAAAFVREAGLKGQVHIGAIDLDPVTLQQVKDGIVDFALDQQPYMQGWMAVQGLYLHVKFGLAPPDVDTGLAWITTENADTVEELVKAGYR